MNYKKIKMNVLGKRYTLFVADTIKKQRLGMKIFEKPARNTGMIFTYNSPVQRSFTMVGVKYPLRIIFFDKEHKIIDDFLCKPGQKNITASKPFSYVIEIPA